MLGRELPTTIADTYAWLQGQIDQTRAFIDCVDLPPAGRAEGLVLRSADRKRIVKIRFEDYQRTVK